MSLLFQPWVWRWEIVIGLGGLGTLYLIGWWRIRRRSQGNKLATVWRLAAYFIGLTIIIIALLSAVDILGQQLFLMHMIQHLLLVMVAPPLLLLANPFPISLWGLPISLRKMIARLLQHGSNFRTGLKTATPPVMALVFFIGCLWIWHLPNAYVAALQSDIIHDLEHFLFFATAILYWWHVIDAGPHIHNRFTYGSRIAYLLLTLPLSMVVGVVLTFASEPVYIHYTTVPRIWGISVLQDQMIGGLIMWIPGSMMYMVAIVILIQKTLKFGLSSTRNIEVFE